MTARRAPRGLLPRLHPLGGGGDRGGGGGGGSGLAPATSPDARALPPPVPGMLPGTPPRLRGRGPRRGLATRAAGADGEPLAPAHAALTLRVLKPQFRALAPAVGLVAAAAAPWVGNLLRWPALDGGGLGGGGGLDVGLGAAGEVARETAHRRSPLHPVTATRSRSQPAAHLDAGRLGHVVGLALARADDAQAERRLRGLGVQTNRVDGQWTGVSMARHLRLVRAVRAAWPSPEGAALVARLAWERARTKADLLRFLLAVDAHVPVLDEAWRELRHPDSRAAETFLASRVTPRELGEWDRPRALTGAFSGEGAWGSVRDAGALPAEQLAALLSHASAHKPGVRVTRHAYRGGPPVPDCVEVAVRELVEHLLTDPVTNRVDVARLPAGADARLRAFFAEPPAGAGGGSAVGGAPAAAGGGGELKDPLAASQEWFRLCQGIRGCQYLSAAPDGSPYELAPSAPNFWRAVGELLCGGGVSQVQAQAQEHERRSGRGRGGGGAGGGDACGDLDDDDENRTRGWTRAEDLEAWSRAHGKLGRVSASDRVQRTRAALSEETLVKHVVSVSVEGAVSSLEVSLEPAHRIANCTFHRTRVPGALVDEEERRALAGAWAQGELPPWAAAFVAALCGDHLALESAAAGADAGAGAGSDEAFVAALAMTPWGEDRRAWRALDASQGAPALDSPALRREELRLAELAWARARRVHDAGARRLAKRFLARSWPLDAGAAELALALTDDAGGDAFGEGVDPDVGAGDVRADVLDMARGVRAWPWRGAPRPLRRWRMRLGG